MGLRPYILAGGQSSRMGTDKAMRTLAGRTLLGRAVDLLRSISALEEPDGKVIVTIVGDRTEVEGADRVILDKHPRCGPLGGIEAALRDLADHGGAEWAFFIPVDMPFLPAGPIDALLREWREAGQRGARVCWLEVDGRIQPLISMVHQSLHPLTVEALTAGYLKVTPVLQDAAEVLASHPECGIGLRHSRVQTIQTGVHRTQVERVDLASAVLGWSATAEQQRLQRRWFSNLNSEEEFLDAETFLSCSG